MRVVERDIEGAPTCGRYTPIYGKPVKVRIVEIQPDGLVTTYKGHRRQILFTQVTRFQQRDRLRNGALIGLLVGAGFALSRLGSCEINCYGAFVPVFGGIGAGVGTLVDAMIRRTTLYIASNRSTETKTPRCRVGPQQVPLGTDRQCCLESTDVGRPWLTG